MHMKLKIGWLIRSSDKYMQVRQKTGGGVYDIDISTETTNEELLLKAKELFFPDGKNSCKGLWTEYEHELGDFKHNIFSSGVSVSEYFEMFPATQGIPRLYLMSRIRQAERIWDFMCCEQQSLFEYTRYLYTNNPDHKFATYETYHTISNEAWEVEFELPDLDVLNEDFSEMLEDGNVLIPTTVSRPAPATDPTPVSTIEPIPVPAIHPTPVSTIEPIPVVTVPIPSIQTENIFEPAGTPTVQFQVGTQRSLSLSRPNNQRPLCSPGASSSFIEVIDSEDEEIALAIEASLVRDESVSDSHPEPASLTNILTRFREKAISEQRSTIIVSRASVLKTAFTAMLRPVFSPRGRIYVKFSGEIGEDYGGPRREFFRLALKELQMSNIFEGPEDSRYFTHDVELLQKKQYLLAGQLVALSLAQDGPSLSSLNENLFDFMVGKDSLMFDCVGILPMDMQNIISELRAISTEPEREQFLLNHGDRLIDQGLVNMYRLTLTSKEEYALLIQKQYICYRTSAEISQFIQGMETLDAWKLVKENKDVFKPLFCNKPKKVTSKVEFDTLYRFVRSEEGSNMYRAEDRTVYGWEIFLQDIEDEAVPVTFEELMIFITGADTIPVLGFSKKIEVMFFNQEPGMCRLPNASTCALQIWLPRETDVLSDIMVRALKESHGFHKI